MGSFSEFYSKVWYYIKSKQEDLIDKKWSFLLRRLEKNSGLSTKEYREFLDSCEIVTDDLKLLEQSSRYEDRRLITDVNELFLFLLNNVQEIDGQVEFKARDIISALDWNSRNTTIFNHDFIVDATTYQPIRPTIIELNQKVKTSKSGYLYLAGAPGSGKSSLLTTWLKGRLERYIRYYAYTNLKANENLAERGESTTLFFDLVLQLREKNIWDQNTLPYKEDSEAVKKAFFAQLELLHQDYLATGLKTIIIIDGLDHLPREYKPKRSFLADLPSPAAVPEGVIVILGSQTFELDELNPNVHSDITDAKLIKIKPLTQTAIANLVKSYNLPAKLLPGDIKLIMQISHGHPLYLTYTLKYLSDKIDKTPLSDLLQNLPEYEGDIEKYYANFWMVLKADTATTEILGLLARIKGAVLPDFILEWKVNRPTLQSFRSKALHFFDTSDDGWAIFHNSFRQFLIQKTALNELTQKFDEGYHKDFHKRLAAFYKDSKVETSWNCLYHLFEAGELDQVITIGTPEYFTEQLLSFRPLHRIEQEVTNAIKIARLKDDPKILVRYLLSLLELQTRNNYINSASFCKQFIQVGELRLALQNLMDNDLLLVNETFALDTALTLFRAGHLREANRLYALSVPDEIQEKGIRLEHRDPMKRRDQVLRKWILIGVLLEPLQSILIKLKNISEKASEDKRLQAHLLSKDRIRRQLYMDAATMLIANNREVEFNKVLGLLSPRIKENVPYWFSATLFAVDQLYHYNQRSKAEELLQTLILKSRKLNLGNDQKIHLANTALRVTGDKKIVASLLINVDSADPVKPDELDHDGKLDVFYSFFLFHKLSWLTGKGQSPIDAVPDTGHSNERSLIEFKRMICRIGRINAESYASVIKSVTELKKELIQLIRFFYKEDKGPTYLDLYWYRISMMIPEYLQMIVVSVSKYRKPYLIMLRDLLEDEMKTYSQFWSANAKRSALMELYENGIEKDWIQPRLAAIELTMLDKGDITQRVEQCTMQADAWIQIEEEQNSVRLLRNTLAQSFGVGYSKDYQLEIWIEWLTKVNAIENSKAGDRISWLAARLHLVRKTSERSTAFDAGISLLRCTLEWSLSAGLQLFQWMLDHELIPFERGLKKVLIALIQNSGKREFLDLALFCKNVFFKFVDRYSHDLLDAIIVQSNKLLSKPEQDKLLNELVNAINIHVLPEYRSEFMLDILELVEELQIDISAVKGLSPATPLKRKDPVSYSPLVIRKNGKTESLSKLDVIARIKSYSDFMKLIQLEDGWNSYFNWGEIIENIPGLTLMNLKDFYSSKTDSKRKSSLNITFSKVALKLGDKILAQAFAKRALDESSEYGWSVGYDGGTRLYAFQALINAEADQAQKLAFGALVEDTITYSDLRSLLPHLDEILPVVSNNYSVEGIWEEIEHYLQVLFAHAKPQNDIPILDDHAVSTGQLFNDLMVSLLKSPIDLISVNVRNFITVNHVIT